MTEEFWEHGHFVARAAGMPDVRRLRLPQPVAGTGYKAMARTSADLAPQILAALEGRQ